MHFKRNRRLWRGMAALLLLTALLGCFSSAQAIYFYSSGLTIMPFRYGGGATGLFSDNNGHSQADNIWIGTVEAPGLGKAFLWQETVVNGGLALFGSAGYQTYTGRLTIQQSPACTLPAGTWQVDMVAGVPYLWLNNVYHPSAQLVVNTGHFSIPVRDQFGQPVVGAVFHVEAATWGGNDLEDFGLVSSDANGVLTIPALLYGDRYYWFTQVSAPAGYSPMAENLISVEIGENGFAAMVNSIYTVPMTYQTEVLNRRTSLPSNEAPPKTGDRTPLHSLTLCMLCAGVCIAALVKDKKRIR